MDSLLGGGDDMLPSNQARNDASIPPIYTAGYLSPAVGAAIFFFWIDPFIDEATLRESILGLLVRRYVLSFCIRSAGCRFSCPICESFFVAQREAPQWHSPHRIVCSVKTYSITVCRRNHRRHCHCRRSGKTDLSWLEKHKPKPQE